MAWRFIAETRKLSVYLKDATSVVLLSDHNYQRRLQSQRDPKYTLSRRIIELRELLFRMSYRPESQNHAADYLNRNPRSEPYNEVNKENTLMLKYFERMN